MTNRWLRRNIHGSIRFCLLTAQTLDAVKVMAAELHVEIEMMPEAGRPTLRKGIRFVPLNDLSRHFVTLDATDLGNILGFGEFGAEVKNDMTRECLANAIKTAFGPNYAHSPDDVMTGGGTRTLYYFTGTVDTDGTAMHLHFRRCARPGEKPPPTDDDDAEEKPKVETPSLPKLTAVPKSCRTQLFR